MLHRFIFWLALATTTVASLATAPSSHGPQADAQKGPATANQLPSANKITVPNLVYQKYKLKNGLEVILSEDHRLPLVAVNLWYHVGPANERPGLTGFAHLFEHMMFEGSKHVGEKAHFKYLEAAGASDINGTTSFDRTNYFETLPSNELEKALWLESDRMGFLLETLDNAKLANQRDVVRNERRQSLENQPYGLVEEAVFHQLFPKEHPYYARVIGSHADVESARLNDVREFFKLYYAPNNASLAIVGDIDKARSQQLVEKYFAPLPAGKPIPKIEVKTPPLTSERRAVITDRVELPRVYLAWITDPIYQPGDAEEDLLAQILGGGKSSRLYKRLVYERQIAQDVSADQESLTLGSVFQIQATAKPGVKPEQLETAIDEELTAIKKDPPTQAEVDRARNIIEARIIRGLERLGGFGGVADLLNRYNHYLGDPGFLQKDIDRYDRVTPTGLQSVAQQKLSQNSRVIIYGVAGEKVIQDVPKGKAEAEVGVGREEEKTSALAAQQAWRNQPPQPGPPSKIMLPIPQQFKLANGLSVLMVERHNLPVVAANLIFLSGSDANPADKPGLAGFTARMLQEGTKKRSSLEIASDADQIGTELRTSSTSDSSQVSIRSLKQNLDAALELMSDVSLNPAFAGTEMERIRKERLTSLLQQRDNPTLLAAKVFYRVVYGDHHPYGFVELGTEDSLEKIGRPDLVRFWSKGYVPRNAALAIAGDITETEARSLAQKYFGRWQGAAQINNPPTFQGAITPKIVIVDKPGSPQTALRVGGVGVARSNPDYVPLEVMNTMLGGLFSSRINMNLREKNGYTYGAQSRFLYRRGPGPFIAVAGVRTDVTGPALKELFNELQGVRTKPLTAAELKMSKDSMARSLPGLFETTPQAAQSIGDLFVYGLPLDYYRSLPAKIDAVGSAEAQRVAEKYIRPDSMIIIAVGDRAKIEPELKKLNLGPIELRDLQGNLEKSAGASQ